MPDFQLSLAIGREGQNARLAARLTGWRIDIHSDAEATERRPRPAADGAPGRATRPSARSRLARGRPVDDGIRCCARSRVPSASRVRIANLHRVPAAGGGHRVAPRRRGAGDSRPADRSAPGHRPRARGRMSCRSSRIRGVGHPAGAHGCIPTRGASISRSGVGRSRGPCGSPARSTRRRCASTSSSGATSGTELSRAKRRPARLVKVSRRAMGTR